MPKPKGKLRSEKPKPLPKTVLELFAERMISTGGQIEQYSSKYVSECKGCDSVYKPNQLLYYMPSFSGLICKDCLAHVLSIMESMKSQQSIRLAQKQSQKVNYKTDLKNAFPENQQQSDRALSDENNNDIKRIMNRVSNIHKSSFRKPVLQIEFSNLIRELVISYGEVERVRVFLKTLGINDLAQEIERTTLFDSAQKNSRNKKTKPPQNERSTNEILPSLEGMLYALEGERQSRVYANLRIRRIEKQGEFYTVTLPKDASEFLAEVKEGWTVAGQRLTDGSHEWIGEIIDIDLVEPVKVVISPNADNFPRLGHMLFYRPDFQQILRGWVQNRLDQDAGLPIRYTSLISGQFNKNLPRSTNATFEKNLLGLRPSQESSLRLLDQSLGLIWGPPGTGKTYTLGAIVAAACGATRKFIVLAPTNAAADKAALAIDDARKKLGNNLNYGELIRPGHPQIAEIESRHHLLAWSAQSRELSEEIEQASENRRAIQKLRDGADEPQRSAWTEQLAYLKTAEKALKERRSRILWKLAEDAQIIVSTIHSLMYNQAVLKAIELQECTLVIDEASMVSRCLFARLLELNVQQILLFGDFKQLSPIKVNNNESDQNAIYWASDSAFDVCGLTHDNDVVRLESEGNFVMLTEQNRMHSEICELISQHFYSGKLTTVGRPPAPPIIPELPAKSLILVDKDSFCEKLKAETKSEAKRKMCLKSAKLAICIGMRILQKKSNASLLLLTPFRDQARLISKLASANFPIDANWKAGTVHVSQGQEADVVIFCPVSPSHPWLKGEYGQLELERLLCVTFSRARTHNVVIAPLSKLGDSGLLSQLCKAGITWSITPSEPIKTKTMIKKTKTKTKTKTTKTKTKTKAKKIVKRI